MKSFQTIKNNLVDKLLKYCFNPDGRKGKPGEIINKLNDDEREICQTLNSKDFQCRDEQAVGYEPLTWREKVNIEKLKFDKKIL